MIPIPHASILKEVHGIEEAKAVDGIDDIVISIPPGQEMIPLPEGWRYLGFIFARGESNSFVQERLREAHGKLKFDLEPPLP